MQQYEVSIPEFDDISTVEASTGRNAVLKRLREYDSGDFEDVDVLEVIVTDELGLKSIYRIHPSVQCKFQCAKVG